jgi:hypothetical protein
MKIKRLFELEDPNYCGPFSLAYCLGILDINKSPRKIIKELEYINIDEGLSAPEAVRYLKELKLESRRLYSKNKKDKSRIIKRLLKHLTSGLPAMIAVSVEDISDHWITALGIADDFIIISDPRSKRTIRRITKNRVLDLIWTGEEFSIVLISPGKVGKPGKLTPKTLEKLKSGKK